MPRMHREVHWRMISDYIGAGNFVLDDSRLVVGAEYGVDCVPRDGSGVPGWKTELGSRCIGVREDPAGSLIATCRGGLFQLSRNGDEEREKLFAEQLVHEAVPHGGGNLVVAGTSLTHYARWDEPSWRFDLREALGASVESLRMIGLFTCADLVIIGAVDYDSGIGRVVVLDGQGAMMWASEPGPLSEVFAVGNDSFVWSLTGYGKFESHLTRLDGQEIWKHDFAGVGTGRSDQSVAMIVGSNEAPRWDHWEYQQLDARGNLEREFKGKGRAPVRPVADDEGVIYFLGYVFHLDPSSSRVDYTNFFAMPQELHFQHLVGIRKQIPEYEIYLQRVRPRGDLEILHHIQGSFSLARPRIAGDEIVFCDGRDIVAVER